MLKKFNLIDFLILLTILLSFTGCCINKLGKGNLNKVIQDKETIAIDVLLQEVYTTAKNLISAGEKTSITIRNRPHASLDIIATKALPKTFVLALPNGSPKTINDPTKNNVADYIITLKDFAIKTEDGYVIGGKKIKIGNPVELEGFNYRLHGKIINIYPLKDEK